MQAYETKYSSNSDMNLKTGQGRMLLVVGRSTRLLDLKWLGPSNPGIANS